MTQTVTFTPIGMVKSAFTGIEGRDWREVVAEIHVVAPLADGLQSIAEHSHIVVIFYLHKSTFTPGRDMVRHPMNRADLPKRGVFATRSNYRPNPLGLTTVKLLKVEGNVLTVKGLDALDGTPVLDIKPYAPHIDCVPDPEAEETVQASREAMIEELTLLLIYLTSWEEDTPLDFTVRRAWKGYPFEVLDTLEEKGLVEKTHRAKSLTLTEKGVQLAQEIEAQHTL